MLLQGSLWSYLAKLKLTKPRPEINVPTSSWRGQAAAAKGPPVSTLNDMLIKLKILQQAFCEWLVHMPFSEASSAALVVVQASVVVEVAQGTPKKDKLNPIVDLKLLTKSC